MELHFYQLKNGGWGVSCSTIQASMPAILNDRVKDAVISAVERFNKQYIREDK